MHGAAVVAHPLRRQARRFAGADVPLVRMEHGRPRSPRLRSVEDREAAAEAGVAAADDPRRTDSPAIRSGGSAEALHKLFGQGRPPRMAHKDAKPQRRKGLVSWWLRVQRHSATRSVSAHGPPPRRWPLIDTISNRWTSFPRRSWIERRQLGILPVELVVGATARVLK